MKSQLKWTLSGIALGALFLWLSLRGTDLDAVLDSLSGARPWPVVAVLATGSMFMILKALRWSVILRPVARAGLGALTSAVYIGTAANLVIAHSGELVRAALVGKRERVAPSAVLASVGIERVFDLIAVAAYLGVLLLFNYRLHESVAAAGIIAIALVLIGLVLMIILMTPSRLRSGLSSFLEKILPPVVMEFVSHQLKRGVVGLSILGSPGLLIQVFLLSLLQWGFIIAAVWFCALSVGHDISVPVAITIWVLMVIGLTLPSSPAQLGTTQLAFTLGMTLTHAQAQTAFAASVVYTLAVNLPYMVIGLGCWLAFGQWHLARVPTSPQ